STGGSWTSKDGSRLVQITGAQSEAYLYDKTSGQTKYLAYLGKNVERVRFSGGTDNAPLKILVDFKNGEFAFFSAEGEPLDITRPEEPAESNGPPPLPDSVAK